MAIMLQYNKGQELSYCWNGHAMMHKANSEKMGAGEFLEKNKRQACVYGHECYNDKKRIFRYILVGCEIYRFEWNYANEEPLRGSKSFKVTDYVQWKVCTGFPIIPISTSLPIIGQLFAVNRSSSGTSL